MVSMNPGFAFSALGSSKALMSLSSLGPSKILLLVAATAGISGFVFAKITSITDIIAKVNALSDILDDKVDEVSREVKLQEGIIRKLKAEIGGLSNKFSKLQVSHITEEVNKMDGRLSNGKSSQNGIIPRYLAPAVAVKLQRYVGPAIALGAIGYGCMWFLDVSVSDIASLTKRSLASALSNITKHLHKRFAALSETMRNLNERIEKYEKLDEQKNEVRLITDEASNCYSDQEYSDRLFDLVMEERNEFPEDFLEKVFDLLNMDLVAARDFISITPSMRKKWLTDIAKMNGWGRE